MDRLRAVFLFSEEKMANSYLEQLYKSFGDLFVRSVNGVKPNSAGDVSINKSDITAILGYTPLQEAPVTSVDGKKGDVDLSGAYQPKGNYVKSVNGTTADASGNVTVSVNSANSAATTPNVVVVSKFSSSGGTIKGGGSLSSAGYTFPSGGTWRYVTIPYDQGGSGSSEVKGSAGETSGGSRVSLSQNFCLIGIRVA